MPVYEIELSDGRLVDVEADSPPSEEELLSSIGEQSQPRPDAMAMPSMQLAPRFDATPTQRTMTPLAIPEQTLIGANLPVRESTSDWLRPRGEVIEPQGAMSRFLEETSQAPIRLAPLTRNESGQWSPDVGAVQVTSGPEFDQRYNTAIGIPLPGDYLLKNLPQGKITDAAVGVRNAVGSFVNFFLSPQGVALAGIGGLPAAAQRTAATYFAYDMARHAPDALEAGDEAMKRGDVAGAVEGWTTGLGSVLMSGASAGHAVRSGKPIPRELEQSIIEFERGNLAPELPSPDVAANVRLGLPPRATPEMLPELQRTKTLVDQAIQEATQRIQIPGQAPALDLLRAQGNEIVPASAAPEFRPGGGEAVGGKVSFNRPAEEIATGRTVSEKPIAEPTKPAIEAAPIAEPIKPEASAIQPPAGDRLVEIVRADGSTYIAAYGDKNYDLTALGRGQVPSIAKQTPQGWSHGMLAPGETIREISAQPRQGTPPPQPETPLSGGKTAEVVAPVSPIDTAINGIENLQKRIRGSGELQMGVPSAILDTALEAARLSLKAGKTVAQAIEAALSHIRKNVRQFDESQVRAMFESELGQSRPVSAARPAQSAGVSGSAAATPSTSSAVSPATPVSQAAPARTLDQTLAKIAKVFEPAPKVKTPIKQQAINVAEAVRTGISSKFRPINKLAEDIAKSYGRSNPKDIAGIMEQLKGSQGKGEADIYRFDKDVSDLVKGDEKAFNEYMFTRRAIDRLNQDAADIQRAISGEEVPALNRRSVSDFTLNELNPALEAMKAKLGKEKLAKFEQAADQYQRHMDEALNLQVESGRMSQEVYQAIKSGNQFYAPFKVMKYLEETTKPEGSGRKIDTVVDFTKAMKGIDDPNFKLGDMLGAARQSILLSRILADKNMAMRHVAELAQFDVDGRFIKKLNPVQDVPAGMEVVNVLENGKQQRYAVNPDVSQAIQLYGGNAGGIISRVLSAFSIPFRAGATALNVPFQASNLMADVPRQALVSKYGVAGLGDLVRYPMDFVHSIFSSIKGDVFGSKNKLFLDFLDSGVAGTTIQEYLTPEMLKFKEPTTISKSRKLASSVLSTIPNFAKAIEQTSKIVGVKRAMRMEGVESGKQLAKEIPEAITEIRRFSGSPDFGRQGKFVEAARLNLLYMFLNARIQGTIADVGRLAGRDGAKAGATAWLRIASAVGIPTAYLYYINNLPQNKADYESRPEQERQNYWLIPKEDENGQPRYITTEDGEKVRDFWRVPKRESSKWIANLTESAMNFAQKRDPKAATDFGAQMLQELSPVNIQGDTAQERLESVASSLNPVIKAPLELATGRDLYRHRPMMSERLQKASPEQQYTERTPEAFKKLAEAMPDVAPEILRSPIILENLTRNLTAGLITQFMPRKPVRGRQGIENQALLQRFQSLPMVDYAEFQEEISGLERQASDESLNRHRLATKVLEDNPSKDIRELVSLAIPDMDRREPTKEDVRLIRHLADLWLAKQNGATGRDRQVISLPARQRALWVQQQLAGLSPEAKTEKLQELARKRIYTEAVAAELATLLQP